MKKKNMSYLAGVRAGLFTVPYAGDIDFGPILERINRELVPLYHVNLMFASIRGEVYN